MAFSGTNARLGACNDALVMGGGTSQNIGPGASDAFQGYGGGAQFVFFDRIRRELWCRTYCNNYQFVNNTGSDSSGSNLTSPITGTAVGNPTVLALADSFAGVRAATSIPLNITGASGAWATINGQHACLILSSHACSIPVDSSKFGALTGSPAYYNGAAIEIDGGTSVAAGNVVMGNLIEGTYYAYGIRVANAASNTFMANSIYDNVPEMMIAFARFEETTAWSIFIHGFTNDQALQQIDNSGPPPCGFNGFINSHQSQLSCWPSEVLRFEWSPPR